MTTLREAAQQALEALEELQGGCTDHDDGTVEAITVWCPEIITTLKAALAEPVQEPVATMTVREDMGADFKFNRAHTLEPGQQFHLYTAPPQRKPLTEEEIDELSRTMVKGDRSVNWLCRAIERAHGIGGQQ